MLIWTIHIKELYYFWRNHKITYLHGKLIADMFFLKWLRNSPPLKKNVVHIIGNYFIPLIVDLKILKFDYVGIFNAFLSIGPVFWSWKFLQEMVTIFSHLFLPLFLWNSKFFSALLNHTYSFPLDNILKMPENRVTLLPLYLVHHIKWYRNYSSADFLVSCVQTANEDS